MQPVFVTGTCPGKSWKKGFLIPSILMFVLILYVPCQLSCVVVWPMSAALPYTLLRGRHVTLLPW